MNSNSDSEDNRNEDDRSENEYTDEYEDDEERTETDEEALAAVAADEEERREAEYYIRMSYEMLEDDENEHPDPEPDQDSESGSFQNLYDLFRIHNSNQIRFTNMSRNNSSNHFQIPFGDTDESTCPVCQVNIPLSQFVSHLVYDHSRFFVSLSTLANPSTTIDDIQRVYDIIPPPNVFETIYNGDRSNQLTDLIYRLMFFEDEDVDMPSYEDLLQLCDHMGYHKKGIENVDIVAPKFEAPFRELFIDPSDTCRICLEPLSGIETVRKINKCDHMFCAPCIETWFKENKTCPLCKLELDEGVNENEGAGAGERNEQTDTSH